MQYTFTFYIYSASTDYGKSMMFCTSQNSEVIGRNNATARGLQLPICSIDQRGPQPITDE
jgi:hypothetical protein